ncbi:MAG: EAL domain-containing protein [Sphingomonadales bacterium]
MVDLLKQRAAGLRDAIVRGELADLPSALQAELTRDIGNYYSAFAAVGPFSALIAIAAAIAARSAVALAFAGIALLGLALVVRACRDVARQNHGRARADSPSLPRLETRFVAGSVLVSAGLGGITTAILVQSSLLIAQAVVMMVTLGVLAIANGSGPGRPQVARVQLFVIAWPVGVALILCWPQPWGVAAGVGLLAFSALCVLMAQRSFAIRMELLAGREAQAAERARLDSAVQNLGQAVAVLDNGLNVVVINRTALGLLGIDAINTADPPLFSDLLAMAPAFRTSAIDRERFFDNARLLVAARQPFNAVMRRDDDRIIDLDCQPMPDAGWVITLRDSTGERNAIAELNREMRRCPVTGLPNRRAVMEELERRLAAGDSLALLVIDLDGFKQINDRHGHALGDRLITRIGFRLRTVEPGLFTARLGSDEFAVLLPAANADAALALAGRMLDTLEQTALFGEAEVQIGAGIGVAIAPEDGRDAEALLRAADLALLAAKAQPGSHICRFLPQLQAQAARAASVDVRVRRGLRDGRIDVAYQPLIDLASGRAVAIEALARWQGGDGFDPIAPGEFVRVAEARGLVGTLRRLVMDRAVPLAVRLDPDMNLWISASVADLREPGMVDEILADLARAGLAPQRLALEITETSLMADERACLANLARLVALGVGVAMDDFGSGFSSLDRLRRLPINALKISQSLLSGAPGNAAAADIFRIAADLGHSLGLMLVAEGVETRAELDLARAAGIHRVQGFALAAPVAEADLPEAIAQAERAAAAGLLRAAS